MPRPIREGQKLHSTVQETHAYKSRTFGTPCSRTLYFSANRHRIPGQTPSQTGSLISRKISAHTSPLPDGTFHDSGVSSTRHRLSQDCCRVRIRPSDLGELQGDYISSFKRASPPRLNKYEDAVVFPFPHRREELDRYRQHVHETSSRARTYQPIRRNRFGRANQIEPEVQCHTSSPMSCGPGVPPLKSKMTRTPGDRCSIVSGPNQTSRAVHQHNLRLRVLPVAAQSTCYVSLRKKSNVRGIKLVKSSVEPGHTVQETHHTVSESATVGHL